MTWWIIDEAVAASDYSAPCKLVLRTLGDQINPPTDWDAYDPEAWDPASHPEAMTVRYDRVRLSLLTSYSPDSVRRIVKELTTAKDDEGQQLDPVLHLDRPARQHHVATYVLDLAALRRHRNPQLVALDQQRKAARQPRRRGRPPQGDQVSQGTYAKSSKISGDVESAPSDPRGRKISPPFTPNLSPAKNLSPFLAAPESAPKPPEKKGTPSSRSKAKTPAPDTLDLTDDLRAWVLAHTPQVDLAYQHNKFLQHCRAQAIENADWIEAFKGWLLDANRRSTHNGHRPGVWPDPVVAQLRADQPREDAVEWPPEPAAAPAAHTVPGGEEAWVRIGPYHGKHVNCGTVHQFNSSCDAVPPVPQPRDPPAAPLAALPSEVAALPSGAVEVLARALAQRHRMPDAALRGEDPAHVARLAARKRLLRDQAAQLQSRATDHGPTPEHSDFVLHHIEAEARPDGLDMSTAPVTNGNGNGGHPNPEETPV